MHRLLLADDSVTVQRVIQLTFAGEDVAVEVVSDGDQAIARLEASPPDIVLADVGMPNKDGYEVAEYLKRSPRLAGIPIVLLTGAFEPLDRVRADAAGCDGVLTKPFEPKQVIAKVRELLNRSAGAAPAGETKAKPASSPELLHKADAYLDQLEAAIADHSNRPAAPKAVQPERASAGDSHEAALPSLADAFAALLAAEHRASGSPLAVTWPAPSPAPAVDDALVDEIVARVLAKLSDRVVRDTVASLVSPLAERLVREEIERIKSSIK